MRPNGRPSVPIHAQAPTFAQPYHALDRGTNMRVRIAIAVLTSLILGQSAWAAAPPAPNECESASTRELLTCLKHCSARNNDASTRVCKQRCLEKKGERSELCAKSKQPRLIVF
jgi:hypothetical protein